LLVNALHQKYLMQVSCRMKCVWQGQLPSHFKLRLQNLRF
jgi:hypothetical protein